MNINATAIARYVNNVMDLLNRIGYDAELGLLQHVEYSTAWDVGFDLAAHSSDTSHSRYRFSFRATPCDSVGNECDITYLECMNVGFLNVEKHIAFELAAAARAAMTEALDEPEDGIVAACGYADLARALTWAMMDVGEETVLSWFMR